MIRARLLAGLLAALAVAGLLVWFAARKPDTNERALRRPETHSDPAGEPSRPSTKRRSTEQPADEGPGAPAVPPDLIERPDLARLRPEARERLRAGVTHWFGALRGTLRQRDWDTLRRTSRAMQANLPVFLLLVRDRLDAAPSAGEALIAGLLFEEHITRGDLPAAERDRLGRRIVPLLAAALAGEELDREQRGHAMRLLSRFPGEASRVALLDVLAGREQPIEMKRLSLLGLAEIGGAAEVEPLRAQLAARDLELVRGAALALGRIGRRTEQPALLAEVRPRLSALYRTALERGDLALFDNVVQTVATLDQVSPAAYLAGAFLDDPTLPAAVRSRGLDLLLGWKAVDQLPALQARRGRLGSPALEQKLTLVIERIQSLRR